MTTTSLPVPAGHYRFVGVVRSEWTKFRTLRSSRWTLYAYAIIGLVLGVVISAVAGSHWATMSEQARANWDPTNNTFAGLAPGNLLVPVLGVLMMSSEYGSGSIYSTFAAVPRRTWVLAAKAVVFGAVTLVVGEAVTFATFFAGQMATGGVAPHATLSQPGVLQAVALSGAALALLGLFGLGIGTIIRHSGAAIASYAGVILVLPTVLVALTGGNPWASKFTPIIILANSIGAAKVPPDVLSPWAGFGMMALYAVVALALGGVLLVRRDV